jgi:hypothetical protein
MTYNMDLEKFNSFMKLHRLGKVVSAWRIYAISKWRYLLYGRGIKIASVTSRIPHKIEWKGPARYDNFSVINIRVQLRELKCMELVS